MLFLILIDLVCILDQLTKHVAIRCLSHGESLAVIPGFFSVRHVRNTGAAWGLFSDLNSWLVLFSFLVLGALFFFRRAILRTSMFHRIAVALIVAGVLGNLLDRLRFGFVVDFFDFYWGSWHFPTFNIADCAICIGVAIYVFASYLVDSPFARAKTHQDAPVS